MGDDNFNFAIIAQFEGYVTSKDRTNVAPNVLVRGSRNVYKKDSGVISVRPGLKRFGVADGTFQGVASSFEWDTSLGTQRALRVLGESGDDTNDGKLQVMYDTEDGLWTNLQTGLSLTRYVFDTYWDDSEKKDNLIMVRGDESLFEWSGGVGLVASATADTITLDGDDTWGQAGFTNETPDAIGNSTTQFDITNPSGTTFRYTYDGTGTDPTISATTMPVGSFVLIAGQNFNAANNGLFVVTASGSNYFEVTNAAGVVESDKTLGTGSLRPRYRKVLRIGGTNYAYTGGESTGTLTGVTPSAAALIAGTPVVQAVIEHANKPADGFVNDFIKTIGNQLYVGSYNSRLVYISANDDFLDYTVPSPRSAGDPELLTLDDNPKGITVRQGNAHIPAGIYAWYVVSFQDITVGSNLTQQTIVDKQEVAAQTTALAHEFIDTVGDDIVYMDQENQVRIYGIFRNIVQAKYPSLSQAVKEELMEIDFTGGALRAIGDIVYITAPITGFTYLHETREAVDGNGNIVAERLWHPPQTYQASRIALINGVEYVHSSVNPQLYQIWDTLQWHDDSPSDEAIAYDCVAALAYQNTERRQGMSAINMIYTEGYMTEGTELLARLVADYQGASGNQVVTVNSVESPAHFFSGGASPSLGDSSLGENPLGIPLSESENDQETLPKFRAINDVNQVNCFEYQVVYYSQQPDSRWELLATGTNAQVTRNQQATFLRKG